MKGQTLAYGKSEPGVNWYKTSRAMLIHDVVGAGSLGRYSKFEAWHFLIGNAAFAETAVLGRGELGASVRFLAEVWGWNRMAVHRFLGQLEERDMIRTKYGTDGTVISICNYDKYQLTSNLNGTGNGTLTGTILKKEDSYCLSKDKQLSSGDDDARATTKAKRAVDQLAVLNAFQQYNAVALQVGLPQAATLTPARKQRIQARLREHGGLDGWGKAMICLGSSPFLRGDNEHGWRANLDFVLQASSYSKLVEGSYSKGKLLVPKLGGTTVRDTSETFEELKLRTGWKPPEVGQ